MYILVVGCKFICSVLWTHPPELIRTDQNWSELIRTDQNWSELIRTDQNWSELIRTGQNWSELVRSDQNLARTRQNLQYFSLSLIILFTYFIDYIY